MQSFRSFGGRVLAALVPALALPAVALAACPSAEIVEKAFLSFGQGEKLDIKKIGPGPIQGLCEVQFKGARGFGVVYVDEKMELIFNGNILDVKGRKSLTQELLAELNAPVPLAQADLDKLAPLVALSLGTKGPVVYFATDPL